MCLRLFQTPFEVHLFTSNRLQINRSWKFKLSEVNLVWNIENKNRDREFWFKLTELQIIRVQIKRGALYISVGALRKSRAHFSKRSAPVGARFCLAKCNPDVDKQTHKKCWSVEQGCVLKRLRNSYSTVNLFDSYLEDQAFCHRAKIFIFL